MPQFAIYPSLRRDPRIAYLLQIQSSRFDRSRGRVMMALLHVGSNPPPDHAITPHLTVLETCVFADPFDIATIPATLLATPLAILAEADQDRIITAIDEMISRA